jgi:hypothetical protein
MGKRRCSIAIARVTKRRRWIKCAVFLSSTRVPVTENDKREVPLAKIDLDSLSIEELAGLRENAADKLFEKVAARRAELEAELEKLAQYGKPVKKAESVPAPKVKKTEEVKEPKEKEPKEQVAKAA